METKDEEIRVLTEELKRIRIKNVKLKVYLDLLVNSPDSETAQKVRDFYMGKSPTYN